MLSRRYLESVPRHRRSPTPPNLYTRFHPLQPLLPTTRPSPPTPLLPVAPMNKAPPLRLYHPQIRSNTRNRK